MKKPIYLDYAAATPVDSRVAEAMKPFSSERFYNPSATYLAARDIREQLDNARGTVAKCLGAKRSEIVFTAGATEANNLAIQGIMRQFPNGEVLISGIEHESVLAPASLFMHKTLLVDKSGILQLSTLNSSINDRTVLVSVGLVNNEIGTIQLLREISRLLARVREERLVRKNLLPLYFHTDAAQAPCYLDIHVNRLGVDLMSLNGGKIYGPKQSGVLYKKTGTIVKPIILGGGQEFNLRSGTENVASSIGFAIALEMAQASRGHQTKEITDLRNQFEERLAHKLPNITINGSNANRAPHISSIILPGVDNERLVMELDEVGVQCAVGSACSASTQKPSHVLSSIGLDDRSIYSTLRFSFGFGLSHEQVQKAADLIAEKANPNR